MSGIRNGWVDTTLGNVLAEGLSNGRSVPTAESGFPVLRLTALVNGRIDLSERKTGQWSREEAEKYFVRSGDFLISRGNGSIRLVGRGGLVPHDDEVAFPDTMIRARPATNALNPQFLRYQWESRAVRRQIEKAAKTTAGIYKVSQGDLLSVALVLAPLPEQRRIVAEIEKHLTRLDAAVATLERVQAELERARASVLKAAVEGRLVPTEAELARAEGRTYEPASVLLDRILEERKRRHEDVHGKQKYKPPAEPKIDGLPELPEGWVWTSVDQLVRERLRNGKSARAAEEVGGIRTLTLSAVTERSFTEANTKLTVATSEQVNGLWLEPGDILVQRSNTPDLVGTTALFSGPRNWAVFPDLLIRVRPCSEASPMWIEFVLRSPRIRQFFKQRAQGIAGSMPKIDQETVARAAVPLPPIHEQHRIVAEVSRRLSVFDALATTVTRNLGRCIALRQSILKRAFSGKLVLQDPTDEPASALLDRIRSSAVP